MASKPATGGQLDRRYYCCAMKALGASAVAEELAVSRMSVEGVEQASSLNYRSLSAVEGRPTVVVGTSRRSKMTLSCRHYGDGLGGGILIRSCYDRAWAFSDRDQHRGEGSQHGLQAIAPLLSEDQAQTSGRVK